MRDWIEATNANPDEHLIEIVIDIKHGTTEVYDRFLWDICSPLADADIFASSFCGDAGLERKFWSKRIADEIRAQCYRYAISRAGAVAVKKRSSTCVINRGRSTAPPADRGAPAGLRRQ